MELLSVQEAVDFLSAATGAHFSVCMWAPPEVPLRFESQVHASPFCAAAKTKRYALSRIRRMVFCAYLGITAEDTSTPPPYARVLAFNDKGREVLRLARKQASLPLITKPAHAFDLGDGARRIFEREALACDLYHLALPGWRDFSWGADWRQDAIYVK